MIPLLDSWNESINVINWKQVFFKIIENLWKHFHSRKNIYLNKQKSIAVTSIWLKTKKDKVCQS